MSRWRKWRGDRLMRRPLLGWKATLLASHGTQLALQLLHTGIDAHASSVADPAAQEWLVDMFAAAERAGQADALADAYEASQLHEVGRRLHDARRPPLALGVAPQREPRACRSWGARLPAPGLQPHMLTGPQRPATHKTHTYAHICLRRMRCCASSGSSRGGACCRSRRRATWPCAPRPTRPGGGGCWC